MRGPDYKKRNLLKADEIDSERLYKSAEAARVTGANRQRMSSEMYAAQQPVGILNPDVSNAYLLQLVRVRSDSRRRIVGRSLREWVKAENKKVLRSRR